MAEFFKVFIPFDFWMSDPGQFWNISHTKS